MPQSSGHISASATIAASGTTSDVRSFGRASRGSFQLPTDFTGTAITVEVSIDGVTFVACPIEGNEVSPIVVAAGKTYSFPVKAFNFPKYRFVAGSTQTTAQTITIFARV